MQDIKKMLGDIQCKTRCRNEKNVIRIGATILFGIGFLLLLISIYGLFIPIKNDSIYTEKNTLFLDDIDKEYQLDNILTKDTSDRELYLKNLVKIVNKSIAHYWQDKGRFKYNLTIPIAKNYILFTASYLMPDKFKMYEFCNFRRAFERGIGLCSEHAIIICGILKEKGIPCEIVGLSGHVVAMAKVKNGWWVLDGDYGAIIPYHIKQIEKDPSIIEQYYENKFDYSDYAVKAGGFLSLKRMIEIYGKEGNKVEAGVRGYCGIKIIIEEASFYAIWIIPFILMLPLVLIKLYQNRLTSRST